MFASFILGMRVARRVGVAERLEKRGDLERALKVSAETLEMLRHPSADLETPWCRASASVALWAYAKTPKDSGCSRSFESR